MTGSLSVVIPTYNRSAILDRCLEHLARQDGGPTTFDVVVVDDASQDNTPALLRRWTDSGRLRLRWTSADKGFAGGARNRGVALAEGERILFLGDDILAAPDLVQQHQSAAGRFGADAIVVGEVSYDPAETITVFMEFLEREGVHHDFPRLRSYGDAPVPGRYLYACNASLSRSAFLTVGGFDETLQRAWEDSELGLRLEAAGCSLHFAPAAKGSHVHPMKAAQYVQFLRAGRADIARAVNRLDAAGSPAPPVAAHPWADRLVGDAIVSRAAGVLDRLDPLPGRRWRAGAYRRLLRYERRRALQAAQARSASRSTSGTIG